MNKNYIIKKMNNIISYYNKNGKIPFGEETKNILIEQIELFRMGKLFNYQIELLKKIPLIYEYLTVIKLEPDEYDINIEKFIWYYIENGKLPNKMERTFLDDQIKYYKHNRLSEQRKAVIDNISIFKKILTEKPFDEEKYMNKVNKVIEYYNINGCLPKKTSYIKDAMVLSGFLYRQKAKYINNKLSKEEINMLYKIPTFEEKLNKKKTKKETSYDFNFNELTYEEKINKISEYTKLYNKLPKKNNRDKNIKLSYNFLDMEKRKYINDELSNENYNLLCNKIPLFKKKLIRCEKNKVVLKFEDFKYTELSYEEKVNKIIEYYNIYGKLPPKTNKYNKEIRSLGSFLTVQKKIYKNKKLPKKHYELLIKIPTYKSRLSGDNKYAYIREKVKRCIDYYNIHNCLPNILSIDDNIKNLSNFLSRFKTKYNRNELSKYERELLLTIPTFKEKLDYQRLTELKKIYEKRVKKCMDYYKKNGKLPSRYDIDNEIRTLGIFINNQKLLHNNNKLSSERIELCKDIFSIMNIN